MLSHRVPFAIAAACFVASITLAFRLDDGSVLLAGALVASGLALSRLIGLSVVAAGLGLLIVWGQPSLRPDPPPCLDMDRPVVAGGLLLEDWRREEFGWRARLRVRSLRQGVRVERWSWTINVSVSGDQSPLRQRRIRLKGYLRRPEGLFNDPPTRAGRWHLRVKSVRFVAGETGNLSTAPPRWLIRQRLIRSFERLESQAAAIVLEALLLGRAEAIPRAARQSLRRLGLSHLFAVSGLHVGLLITGAFLLFAPAPRGARAFAAAIVVIIYVMTVGPRPSILRAALMAGVTAVSMILRRPTGSLHVLAVTIVVIVAASPEMVLDLGFQLTASATAGIVLLSPALARKWRSLPLRLGRPLAAGVAAQIGSAPWVWSQFGMFTPLAPAINLVAIPWLVLLLATCFVWAFLECVWLPAADVTSELIAILALPLFALEDVPKSRLLTWPLGIGTGEIVLAAGLLCCSLVLERRLILRLVLASVAAATLVRPLPGLEAELNMLDVGQGDSLLLRDGRSAMLIDGGGWRHGDIASRVLLPALARRGVRRLDSIVLTHGDIDHCQGVVDVAAYLPVGEVRTGTGRRSGCSDRLSDLRGISLRSTAAGDSWSLGRWRVRVLHPLPTSALHGNNASLVLQVRGFGRTILLAGDIEREAELEIARRLGGESLRSDILKIAHHGSRTSTTAPFLDAVAPRLALLSAGRENRYGHPSTVVLDRLRRAGILVLRSDRDGMVRILFHADGSTRIERFGHGGA